MMWDSITRLYRKVMYVIGRGRITLVDDSQGAQVLQINLGSSAVPLLVDGVPSPQHFGFTSNPPVGSDVGVAFIGGDRANGYAIVTNNQSLRLKNLNPGEVAIYDSLGRYVKLGTAGIVVEANGADVTVQNGNLISIMGVNINLQATEAITMTAGTSISVTAPEIEEIGNVAQTGVLTVTEDVIGNSLAPVPDSLNKLAQYDFTHTHPVPGIAAGTATVESGTGVPVLEHP